MTQMNTDFLTTEGRKEREGSGRGGLGQGRGGHLCENVRSVLADALVGIGKHVSESGSGAVSFRVEPDNESADGPESDLLIGRIEGVGQGWHDCFELEADFAQCLNCHGRKRGVGVLRAANENRDRGAGVGAEVVHKVEGPGHGATVRIVCVGQGLQERREAVGANMCEAVGGSLADIERVGAADESGQVGNRRSGLFTQDLEALDRGEGTIEPPTIECERVKEGAVVCRFWQAADEAFQALLPGTRFISEPVQQEWEGVRAKRADFLLGLFYLARGYLVGVAVVMKEIEPLFQRAAVAAGLTVPDRECDKGESCRQAGDHDSKRSVLSHGAIISRAEGQSIPNRTEI